MESSSSSLCLSIKVSYRAIRLLFPKPEKYALDFEDLREPSITSILLIGKLAFCANSFILFFNDPSSKGVKVLNRGAINSVKSGCTNIRKIDTSSQAYSQANSPNLSKKNRINTFRM